MLYRGFVIVVVSFTYDSKQIFILFQYDNLPPAKLSNYAKEPIRMDVLCGQHLEIVLKPFPIGQLTG